MLSENTKITLNELKPPLVKWSHLINKAMNYLRKDLPGITAPPPVVPVTFGSKVPQRMELKLTEHKKKIVGKKGLRTGFEFSTKLRSREKLTRVNKDVSDRRAEK